MTSTEVITTTDEHEENQTIDSPKISDAGYFAVAVLLSVVWVLGTVFNVISLCVFIFNKRLRSPTNLFVMSLNLCDLMMSFVGTFMTMTSAWKKEWLYGRSGCIFEGFTVYFLGLTSMYLLSAISLDRYILIAKPLLSPRITHKVAKAAIGACWLGGFLWSAFPLFGWNEYVMEGAGISCSVVWESSNPVYTSYIFTIFVFVLLLPLIVMCFSYYNVYMTIRSFSKNKSWKESSRVSRRNLRVEKKMARTTAFILGSFLVCWMPYAIFSFTVVFKGSDAVSKELATYPAVLAKAQGLLNPLLYVATNKQFRQPFVALHKRAIPDGYLKAYAKSPHTGEVLKCVQAFYDLVPCPSLRQALHRREEVSQDSDEDEGKGASPSDSKISTSDTKKPAIHKLSNSKIERNGTISKTTMASSMKEGARSKRTASSSIKTKKLSIKEGAQPVEEGTQSRTIQAKFKNKEETFEIQGASSNQEESTAMKRTESRKEKTQSRNAVHPVPGLEDPVPAIRTVSEKLESAESVASRMSAKDVQSRGLQGESLQVIELADMSQSASP